MSNPRGVKSAAVFSLWEIRARMAKYARLSVCIVTGHFTKMAWHVHIACLFFFFLFTSSKFRVSDPASSWCYDGSR
jgi:hypothetical protein